MGKGSEQTFLKKKKKTGQQTHENIFNSLAIRGMQSRPTMRPLYTHYEECNQEDTQEEVLMRMWRNQNAPNTAGWDEN